MKSSNSHLANSSKITVEPCNFMYYLLIAFNEMEHQHRKIFQIQQAQEEKIERIQRKLDELEESFGGILAEYRYFKNRTADLEHQVLTENLED